MNKSLKICALLLALTAILGGLPIFAATAYQTYSYSYDGVQVNSPDAYVPYKTVNSAAMGLKTAIMTPGDICVDPDDNVYISDTGLNRVIALDPYYNLRFEISTFVNGEGVEDALNGPTGLFVSSTKIYVCDTKNARIVVFDRDGNFVRILEKPKAKVLADNSQYQPIAVAVDTAERIYVISATTYMGVMVLDSTGNFQSFIGAQAVRANALELLWRRFQTPQQRAKSQKYISTEFNNITIDADNFIYVTTSSISEDNMQESIKSNSSTYSPVKRLNALGEDVMARNGFFGPGGEVETLSYSRDSKAILGASIIVDVAVSPDNTWSIIDQRRSKVFTYDTQGNLLFAFGDIGSQLGNIQSLVGITYQGEKLLLLDKTDCSFTVFNRTEYGDILIAALRNNEERNYDAAVDDWNNILQRNGNFDTAYIGIGSAYYRQGDYDKAMEYFKAAYDTDDYDSAYKLWRSRWVSKYVLVIPVVVVAFFFVLSKFFGYAKKVNKRATLVSRKRTFKEQWFYAFYLQFHPFDGFWDLKHEKRGSVLAGSTFVGLTILAFTYESIGKSYLYNPYGSYFSIFDQIISVVVPLALWVTANWCLTTLFDGEGSFKDVYIATTYSLAPLPFFIILSTLMTHIMSASESGIVSMISTIGWIWSFGLIFFGMMVTHDYSLFKNLLTSIGTIVGMAFIMFVGLLFSSLVGKIIGFVSSIISEISYRI